MRKTFRVVLGSAAALVLGLGITAGTANAAGYQYPSENQCREKDFAKDNLTKGACVIVDRRKGNCMACHQINGLSSGDLATPLGNMKGRYAGEDGKKRLRAQIENPHAANKNSIMPPFGRNGILSKDEITHLVDFLLTI
jgi:sulfur-oxidizing protein SoxX